jgi:hypothetical protein
MIKISQSFGKLPTALILTIALTGAFVIDAYADSSVSACGYTYVHHDDGTWTVRSSQGTEWTYSSGYTLADLKKEYCK